MRENLEQIIVAQPFEPLFYISSTNILQAFNVKGYISIGELKLVNNLVPELTKRIAPAITKQTRTMIDAMGEPFHYEQLLIRLLLVDIARRHEARRAV